MHDFIMNIFMLKSSLSIYQENKLLEKTYKYIHSFGVHCLPVLLRTCGKNIETQRIALVEMSYPNLLKCVKNLI